jgi:hypothetical protein
VPRRLGALLVVALLAFPRSVSAYGVLAHEAIIDAVWASSIAPLLRARYHVDATALEKARAYAYGGAIIQDSGYYPLSSRTFGDFTHYVRSGDFIAALLRDASNANEYAFALGALAHYAADNNGHPIAINRSVPLLFPKLERQYGDRVTYEENPSAHLRTEFGFDVVQVARGAYAPKAYHDFIGFEVATPVLERAFHDTYGLELKDVFGNYGLAIGTFRWAVSQAIPSMTKVAWQDKRQQVDRTAESRAPATAFTMTRAQYEDAWGQEYKRPNVGHRILAWVIRVLPKVGPLRSLAFKPPTPETERYFVQSFNDTVERYKTLLTDVRQGSLRLANRNFDTGQPAIAGSYGLADDAYAEWVKRLADAHFDDVTPAIRANVLGYYKSLDAPIATKASAKKWRALTTELDALRTLRTSAR